MNRWLLSAAALTLWGCPKSNIPPANELIGTKWEGRVDVTSACKDHGGYSGDDLRMCLVFREVTDTLFTVDVDWDPSELRESCDYFSFLGTPGDEGLTLIRRDKEEPDDKLRLQFADGKLVGTFEVHPSCGQWPVELVQIPLPPSAPPTETMPPL